MEDPLINFAVYGLAALFEGVSWWFGWNAFQRSKGIMDAVRASKGATSFMA